MRSKMLDIRFSPNRLYAHGATIILMALIQTNQTPTLWQTALVAVLFDELFFHLIKTIRRELDIRPGKYRIVKHWWEEFQDKGA